MNTTLQTRINAKLKKETEESLKIGKRYASVAEAYADVLKDKD